MIPFLAGVGEMVPLGGQEGDDAYPTPEEEEAAAEVDEWEHEVFDP